VVAGGNGKGNRTDQLNWLTDVIVDKETDSLIICDFLNRRVIRWSRRSKTKRGETIIDNIVCQGLTMDDERFLYVSDLQKHEVRRYRIGETKGTVVAGGNGKGDGLNQLNEPIYLFVDRDHSVYVSDKWNFRVMKWNKDAKEGIVVAGRRSNKNAPIQLRWPQGVFVDQLGTVYVADWWTPMT
jgi:sugar lactone lactonase YvrE